MAKLTVPTILSGYLSTETLNAVLQDIAAAFENTLSRDGTTPNQMMADLDLNGHRILNTAGDDDDDSLVTRGSMEEYVDERASGLLSQKQQIITATAGQQQVDLTAFSYTPGSYNIGVYVNGTRKFAPTDYSETSATRITFSTPLVGGEKITVVHTDFLATVEMPLHTHAWADITGAPVYTTRWPTWNEVTGKPASFTPSTHFHAASDISSGRLADARRGVHVQSGTPTASTIGEIWAW